MTRTLGDPARHFFMTRSVARAMGIHLGDAMQDGHLAPEAYSAMVTRCRACPMVANCETWLATQTSGAAKPPEGCCNGDAFLRILDRMR